MKTRLRALIEELRKEGRITPADFDDQIEWTWWELWCHEGRRARHGASMMGPDYSWWHGIYEVAKHFYISFIPQVREAAGGGAGRTTAEKSCLQQ